MNVFLSGPMSGVEGHNRPAFDAAEVALRAHGHEVWNPCRLIPFSDEVRAGGFTRRECLATDLSAMLDGWDNVEGSGEVIFTDAVVVLPGWRDSRGSMVEVTMAHEVGIPVMTVGEALGAGGEG